jgi:hypothetical protein
LDTPENTVILLKNKILLSPHSPPLFYVGQRPGEDNKWYIFWGKKYWNKPIESKLSAMIEADELNQKGVIL